LRAREQQAWRESSLCFTVSDKERDFIRSYLGTGDKVHTAPNGVDLERFEFHPKTNADKRLLFLGGMDYLPNLDSAYFLQEIFQLVQAQVPDVRVDFIGRELWRINNASFSQRVSFHENVPDVLTWFREADVLVVPLRLGEEPD
jgi:glycosyltransferase involved in cell wall biosynthesis